MDREFDCGYKVILVGDAEVGKSALLLRFTNGDFNESYKPTYGLDLQTRTINIDGKNIKLWIWDTPGQKKFKTSQQIIYNYGHDSIIFIYNVISKESFENLKDLVKEAELYTARDFFGCVIGSKIDLEENRQVSFQEGLSFAQQLGIDYFEVSSKDNKHVEEVFIKITQRVQLREIKNQSL